MKPTALALAIVAVMSIARSQVSTWVTLSGPAGGGRGFAYDAWRDRGVMVGTDGQTWEWDGAVWLHRPTANAPFARSRHAMAFDSLRGHCLLFGGLLPSGSAIADTWTWDGSEWRQPFSLLMPPRRSGAAMAFDRARGRMVLFGGQSPVNLVLLNDTWEHDGTQWIPRTPATQPTTAMNAAMAFDAARGVTLLLLNNVGVAELWAWNGIDWALRSIGGLSFGGAITMAYADDRQRTVVLGAGSSLNEVWEWNGTSWLLRGTSPQSRSGHGTAFDSRRGLVLFAGGQDAQLDSQSTAMLAWDGASTSWLAPNSVPVLRNGAATAFDPARGRVMLFGGTGLHLLDDQWEWDGQGWAQMTGAHPSARQAPACCFDPLRREMLMFSGLDSTGCIPDSWRWNGSTWSPTVATGPAARAGASMAWDSTRGRVVMFGGRGSTTTLNDTWTWNGTAWTSLVATTPPPPRRAHGMAYDPVRDRIVLHGGTQAATAMTPALTDTWEFDGQQWTAALPAHAPAVLAGLGMVHDLARGRTLLAGIVNTPVRQIQTWEFDGTDWAPSATVPVNAGVATVSLLFDSQRQRVVMLDGDQLLEAANPPSAIAAFGQGCGALPPILAARTRPRTGAAFGLDTTARPFLPVVFALGLGQGNVPLGNGCTLLVQQTLATMLAMADARGFAGRAVPLPGNQALRGLLMTAQAGVIDPSARGGFTVSGGLLITVGD
jgi:hypothetical protein